MKILTLKQLEAKAEMFFKKVHQEKIFATSDGQFFLNGSDAKNHAGPKGTVFDFDKSNYDFEIDDDTAKPQTAKDVVDAIAAAQSLEQLEAYQHDDRKTVKVAYEKRYAELHIDSDDDGNEEVEVTQEMLDANPDLLERGVQVGELIKIPVQ